MKTKIWSIPHRAQAQQLRTHPSVREAAAALRAGQLIAFPTETVYGLGADALNNAAVANVFKAKGRPGDNPLIVHIGHSSQLKGIVAEIPPSAKRLIHHFWPGPLTLVLPSAGVVSARVTAGLTTVAVRMPNHPAALALLQEVRRPVAAPSANRSGRPSPTEARHVLDDLDGRIDGLVDGGQSGYGLESTVLDVSGEVPVLLRPGGIIQEQLERVLGEIKLNDDLSWEEDSRQVPRSPGTKYRHYAPLAKMTLVRGSVPEMVQHIQELTTRYQAQGLKVGVLTTKEHKGNYDAEVVIACGKRTALSSVARDLYRALRQFDANGVDRILAETFPESGWGATIMNRLRKAANGEIIERRT